MINRGSADGNFPTDLDIKEQKALDALGGPTNKLNPNGGASNKKNVIKKYYKLKLKEGYIFNIPIDADAKKIGFGQIVSVSNNNNFIITVFEDIWNCNENPSLESIVKGNVLFMGYTMDAKLYHKHWNIIGCITSNLKSIDFPIYCLGTPPEDIYIVDYKGKILRECAKEEFKLLSYQKIVAPVRYEKALKAFHGFDEWKDYFDELKIDNLLKGKRIIELE